MQPPPIGRALFRRSPRATSTPSAIIFSGTTDQRFSGPGRELPVADVVEETLGCVFHQVQYVLELVGTTGVRIGDLPLRRVGGEIQEGSYDSVSPAEGRDYPVVPLVHSQDVIEDLAVLR